jgi:hypothetical protein
LNCSDSAFGGYIEYLKCVYRRGYILDELTSTNGNTKRYIECLKYVKSIL